MNRAVRQAQDGSERRRTSSGRVDPVSGGARASLRGQRVSAHAPEEGAQLVDEQLGLLERREVSAALQLVPVTKIGEAPLRYASGEAEDLLGKDRASGRDADGRDVGVAEAFPVEPGRRGGRAGQPVEH